MTASDEKTAEPKCPSCGVAIAEHLGLYGTCNKLRQLESQNAALASQLAAMQERCERLAAILKSLEWSGVDRREYETVYFCPTCLRRRPEHNPNCELAAALAQQEGRNAE